MDHGLIIAYPEEKSTVSNAKTDVFVLCFWENLHVPLALFREAMQQSREVI